MQSAHKLAEVAKALRTNKDFKTEFKATTVPKNRRNRIETFGIQMGYEREVDKIADRESLRLLLEHLLNAGDCTTVSSADPSYSLAEMLQAYDTTSPATSPATTKENTMSKAITVTTQVNINGVNADNYTNAQLFDMIRQQEGEIKNLLALANKPQSLLREIDTRQAGIDALVSFMNERDAKLNPQPVLGQAPAQAVDQLARD